MMTAQRLKQQRLHIRLDANAKQKLERAAVYANRTLSEFVLSRALDAADAVILEHETLRLSNADWQVFLDALDTPPSPTPGFDKRSPSTRNACGDDPWLSWTCVSCR